MTTKKDENYRFIHKNVLFQFASFLLFTLAILILPLLNLLNYNIRIYGKHKLKKINSGAVICPTHNVALDCAITSAQICFPKRLAYIVTTDRNVHLPIIGVLIQLLRGIGIPTKLNAKKEFFATIHTLLKINKWVVIYPEGDLISFKKELAPFKRGAFVIASEANVPIVPIVYTYTKPHGIFAVLKKKPFITGYILDPIYPDMTLSETERPKAMALKCETLMRRTFEEKNEIYYTPSKHSFRIENIC